jgi:hypothetical protein
MMLLRLTLLQPKWFNNMNYYGCRIFVLLPKSTQFEPKFYNFIKILTLKKKFAYERPCANKHM